MTADKIQLRTLKDCLQFLQWLNGNKGVQEQLAYRLKRLLDGKYKTVDQPQIENALTTFLSSVSKFHAKLCTKPQPKYTGQKTAKNVLNVLLDCIPKLLSALYFLRYQVDPGFDALGGGKWKDEMVGWVEMYARIRQGTASMTGPVDKYLIAPSGDTTYGVMPGGFDASDLKSGHLSGYSPASKMVKDIQSILNKQDKVQNYFLDVYSTTVIPDSGAETPNVANALRLVEDFCRIFGGLKSDEEFKSHLYRKNRCIQWNELRDHCNKLKTSLGKIFSKDRFSFTGYARQDHFLKHQDIAKKMASWFQQHLGKVKENVTKIQNFSTVKFTKPKRGALKQVDITALQNYFINNFIRYGFTFYSNSYTTQNAPYELLQKEWDTAISELKSSGGGLQRLVDILNGEKCKAEEQERQQRQDKNQENVDDQDEEEDEEPEDEELLDSGKTVKIPKPKPPKPVVTKAEAAKPTASKVEGTSNQGKKSEGAQNQGKKAEGARNQGKKSEGAQNQGKKAEGAQNQGKKSEGAQNQGKKADGAQNQGKKAEGAQNQGKKTEGAQNQGKKSEGAQNQGKKAEGAQNQGKSLGTTTPLSPNQSNGQSADTSSGSPVVKSDAPPPSSGDTRAPGPAGSTGPVTPASSSTQDTSSNQGVKVQTPSQPPHQLPPGPPSPPPTPPQVPAITQRPNVSGPGPGSTVDQGIGQDAGKVVTQLISQPSDPSPSSVSTAPADTAPGGGGSGETNKNCSNGKPPVYLGFDSGTTKYCPRDGKTWDFTARRKMHDEWDEKVKEAEDERKRRREERLRQQKEAEERKKQKDIATQHPIIPAVQYNPPPPTYGVHQSRPQTLSSIRDDDVPVIDGFKSMPPDPRDTSLDGVGVYEFGQDVFSVRGVEVADVVQSPAPDSDMPSASPLDGEAVSDLEDDLLYKLQDQQERLFDAKQKEDNHFNKIQERILQEIHNKAAMEIDRYQKEAEAKVVDQKMLQTALLRGANVDISHPKRATDAKEDYIDVDVYVPKRRLPDIDLDFDLDFDDDSTYIRNDTVPPPPDPYIPKISFSLPPPEAEQYLPTTEKPKINTVVLQDNCPVPWLTQKTAHDSTDIPETELFPAEAPRTVKEMLTWIAGLQHKKHQETMKQCIEKAFKRGDNDPSDLRLLVNDSSITAKDVIDTIHLAAVFAASVLTAVAPEWKGNIALSATLKRKDPDQSKDSDCCALLCQLQDYVYACYHQLAFLRSQSSRVSQQGGWQDCQYGSDIKLPSPLQAFLIDAPDSKFKTHPFDPCNICRKSRVNMGFSKEDLPTKSQNGEYIFTILTPTCGGEDPLLRLASYLTCLTRRTPRTTGELVSFFHNFGNELHDAPSRLSPLGSALFSRHDDCPKWDRLKAADLHVIKDARGPAPHTFNSIHDQNHAKTLSALIPCAINSLNCPQHLSPITYRAYALYSSSFAHHYLSWTVYLADRLWESLLKLLYDLEGLQCHDFKPIQQCANALPLLYSHGFTPPGGASQSSLTCSEVVAKLEEVVSGEPIASLMTAMDAFLYRIRMPFLYTIIALWLTATLYIAHSLLYRMDVLRIRSHLTTTRASHLIDVKALLAGSRRMLSLYKDVDYFDDDFHS
ncbi:Ribosome-binding protein 1 [Babesia ovata]|uniref:Ribosome-binding protein 1 n=1 Tax=Babesia ovata TaxID=189622 RepID=A0A2H6KIP0_9APIC|nr:Ribosome-binding protein 1 [Babesia ovata]GBE62849.1 Ribosome-binding protein 1 [Babesia ovata]